jgi:hypothetical protein
MNIFVQRSMMHEHRDQHSSRKVEDNSTSSVCVQNVLDPKGSTSFTILKLL